MKNLFNSVKMTRPNKSAFDMSHDVKLSLDMGELVPTCCLECVPGDSFNIGCETLLRFQPLISPVMHRMDVYMHYFFVPNRLLWDNWENFITNTEVAGSLPAFPYTTIGGLGVNTYTPLMDYFGIPDWPGGVGSIRINPMPFAAYQLIFNEYYRDQNLVAEQVYKLVDGNQGAISGVNGLATLRKRSWEHDYFTSALPFAQKGSAVAIPLGEVTLDPDWVGGTSLDTPNFKNLGSATPPTGALSQVGATPAIQTGGAGAGAYDPDGSLEIQTTTINDLRRAFRLQEWLEKSARGGSRYVENILSFFGVRSSDKRMQRPEYITGTKSPVVISEVLNTTGTVTAPQGTMAGHGVSVTTGKYGKYFCEEHGYIIGIMSVLPKTAYQQGIEKMWHKGPDQDPFNYYWPQFAHIGEQAVKNKELYAYTATDDDDFGYVPRYAEYKFMNNRVAGDFRSTLNFWHLGRIFAAQPALNQTFVESDPTTRVFAVSGAGTPDKLLAHVLHKIRAVRPMPKYGTPTF